MGDPKSFGALDARYTFLLNPHADCRLSRCPKCEKLTYPRKFPLLIGIGHHTLLTLGMTCKYCSGCETIMCQQDDLEIDLAIAFAQRSPELLGKEYVVIGTVELNAWKKGLRNDHSIAQMDEMRLRTADFKSYSGLSISEGGWYAAGQEPKRRPASRPQIIPALPPQSP